MRTRINFRLKWLGWTAFWMISKTQTLKGIVSQLKNGKHIPLWDLEPKKFSLQEILDFLRVIQRKYGLSNIYLLSDKIGSYRAWCFSQVDFSTYIKILADSLDIIDYNFFYWTVYLSKATLRISPKYDRPNQQKIVAMLESYYVPFPKDQLMISIYDTGYEKSGIHIEIPPKREVLQ